MSDSQAAVRPPSISLDPLKAVLAKHEHEEGALIPVLQETQELYGYLPREAVMAIARSLRLSPAQVYAVATFYAQFYITPRGKHIIRCCEGTACHVRGAEQIITVLEKELGIEAGETTPDMEFTLETVACIGACGLAPTMVIDEETYGKMTIDKVRKLVKSLRARSAKGNGSSQT